MRASGSTPAAASLLSDSRRRNPLVRLQLTHSPITTALPLATARPKWASQIWGL